MDRDKQIERLAECIDTMDIPENRKKSSDSNRQWLGRNMFIRNRRHARFNEAKEILKKLRIEVFGDAPPVIGPSDNESSTNEAIAKLKPLLADATLEMPESRRVPVNIHDLNWIGRNVCFYNGRHASIEAIRTALLVAGVRMMRF